MIELKEKPLIVAVVGKGGVGKTVITVLITKALIEDYNFKILLIDGDPTYPHLSRMVKLYPNKSLETIRSEVIVNSINQERNIKEIAENIDFKVYNALTESKKYSLFSLGQPEGPGCFCPSNLLLKKVIESISQDFEIVLIDCEAGLEQINRMVINSVDIVLIVSDPSQRSIDTTNSIKQSAKKFTNFKKIGVILNKVKGSMKEPLKKLKQYELPLLASLPEDMLISAFDLEGKPLIEISNDSVSYQKLRESLEIILSL